MNSNRDYATENINLKKRLETLKNKNAALKIKVRAWEIQGEKYKQENEKLKKALDILKKYYKIIVKDADFPTYVTPQYTLGIRFHSWNEKPEGLFAYITKEDFELLKEVLGE